MRVKFEKWHGCKNDFIVIDTNQMELIQKSLVNSAPLLCSRDGDGVGADGIIILHKTGQAHQLPTDIAIINSDGSIASTCGNGIRCAAMSVLKNAEKYSNVEDLSFLEFGLVDQSTITCSFIDKSTVRVSMGKIEVHVEGDLFQKVSSQISKSLKSFELNISEVAYCSISNSHLVIVSPEASKENLRSIGPLLQDSPLWDGINVHLVKSMDPSALKIGQSLDIEEAFEVWTWERGAGETNACGSGACAVGAFQLNSEMIDRSKWVGVRMPGGDLLIKQDSKEDDVILAGPAKFVYSGELEI